MRQWFQSQPPSGQCPQRIPDALMFERTGDDNIFYFQDPVQHFLVGSGPAPLGLDQPGKQRPQEEVYANAYPVAPGKLATSQLKSEHGMVKQSFILQGYGSTVKMFLDAWLHYQTVPIVVTASSLDFTGNGQGGASYAWRFINYVPIGDCAPLQGSGVANACPSGLEEAPIIRTLGHTRRAPNGEFPVSQETMERTCHCEQDRPALFFSNTSRNGAAVRVTISIGV